MADETVTDPALAQIVDAPKKAYYITPDLRTKFKAQRDAASVNRQDLTIVALPELLKPAPYLGSWQKGPVVIDHACGDLPLVKAEAIARITA